ncbi:hypothetical protein TrCOL_g10525 [Triparma columacea]|uniref:Methionine aminopeptidase n=1 Tax=Triparma columacea TaxID=722753 RepID=A0A9W7LG27_9STRA|nr:hypothetical protein TrCOL_g10525 [Triparma columacea]
MVSCAAGSSCITNSQDCSLACPTCTKYEMTPSYFCNQECFKKFWPQHKSIHAIGKKLQAARKAQAEAAAVPDHLAWASAYNFTGPLRPREQTPTRTVPARIRRPDYATDPDGRSREEEADKSGGRNLKVYSGQELEDVKHTCKMGREVLDCAGRAIRVGATCDEIDRVVHEACLERDCYPSPLNYYNFPKSVCTSVNEVICHGIPDKYEIQDGDIVNVDVTTYTRGCHGDLNETFMVGDVDEEGRMLVETAFTCLQKALAMCKPGTLYRDLGGAIHRHAKDNGCSVVKTYCGHGIGNLFHTGPNVPHYAKNKAKGVMREGHVFTVEPMINLGTWEDVTWGDNWTAVTRDGKRSAQFEHTVVVTDKGVDILTMRDDEPVMVWDASKNQR